MLRLMGMERFLLALVVAGSVLSACTDNHAEPRPKGGDSAAVALSLSAVTFGCEFGNGAVGIASGRPAVTVDVDRPHQGVLTASVTGAKGELLGQRDLQFHGNEPRVAFSVPVVTLNIPGSHLTLRDAQRRTVGSALVAMTRERDCIRE